jgi:hypothetical protein
MSDDPAEQITTPQPPDADEAEERPDDELDATLADAEPVEDDATEPDAEDPTAS